jgi:type IV pilus biogenesis protein CpaD/CtpE
MHTFFALIKADHEIEHTATLITTETILSAVEQEFDKEAREHCEKSDSPVFAAKLKLATKWALVEFFPYDLNGARSFLKVARGMGIANELQAVKLVQGMRDHLTHAIDRTLNVIRANVAHTLLARVTDDSAPSQVDYVRNILNAGPDELIQIL